MKFSIWSNLDDNFILGLHNIVKKYNFSPNNIEVFLAFPWFKMALDRYINTNISIDDFFQHIKLIKNKLFNVRYVFNNFSINIENNIDNINFILDKLLVFWINNITIADIKLADYINSNYQNKFNITLSWVVKIDSINKFSTKYNDYTFDKVVLSHSINYDFKNLIKLIRYFNWKWFKVELIWNELIGCNFKCNKCYLYDAYQWDVKVINEKMIARCDVFKNKRYIFDSKIIRPEDIYLYDKIWVYSIKLGLRESVTLRALKIVESYILWKHKWNLFDLLASEPNDNYFIDNSVFNNFLLKKYILNK